MKKCYLTPSVSMTVIEVPNMLSSSPGSNPFENGNGSYSSSDFDDAEELDENGDFTSRGRGEGSDFGSLW